MTRSCVLVADACSARIFSSPRSTLLNGQPQLKLIKTLEHPESREYEQGLVSDKQGSRGGGTMVAQTTPKHHEADNFAREICEYLQQQVEKFDDLIVVTKGFHQLSSKINQSSLKKRLSANIPKNYTQYDLQDLGSAISNYL